MLGMVSCVKHRARESTYFITWLKGSGIITTESKSSVSLNAGELIDTNDDINDIHNVVILSNPEKELRKITSLMAKKAEDILSKNDYRTGNEKIDKISKKMDKKLKAAAEMLMKKIIIGAPIVIRFHNDADGSSGAYALYKSLEDVAKKDDSFKNNNIVWIMNKGVIYGIEEANYDLLVANGSSCIEKPLLLIIDFGTSDGSNVGLKTLKDRFDIIWLDHHPPDDKFECCKLDNYVNPWHFGIDSNYTAGLLTSIFTKQFSKIDTTHMENASLIGDYSEYAREDEPSSKLSLVLDAITSDSRIFFGSDHDVTPMDIDEIVKNKEKWNEILSYATNRMNETIDAALRTVRIYKSGSANIYVLDFEDVRTDESKYPLPGRFASKLLERLDKENPNGVLIVHVGNYIMTRVSKKLGEKLSALDVINEMKEFYKDGIESGGGHARAASLKLYDKSSTKAMLKVVIDNFKKRISEA